MPREPVDSVVSTRETAETATTGDTAVVAPVDPSVPFVALLEPVWEGRFPAYGTAGDPSVRLADGGGYEMVYTDYAEELGGADTWRAVSPDGIDWTLAERVLVGRPEAWDGAHETPFSSDADTLFAIGYPSPAEGFVSGADVGRWIRGRSGWALDPADPVISRGPPGALDHDAITSPSVARDDLGWVLAYTGWCFACAPVVTLLAATSSDGVSWTKAPLSISDPGLGWSDGGIAETHLVRVGDAWWLLFTSVDAELPHRIGLATASDWRGPWTFLPDPVLVPEVLGPWAAGGLVAPHLLVGQDELRLWFAGQDAAGLYRVGTASRPL